jgi:serralysin
MEIFRITPTTSVFASGTAFSSDSPGADTLIVEPGAFLVSTGFRGASLAPTGAWTVTVNGSIVSATDAGILLGTGVSVSTIKIGVDGEVQGATAGIILSSSANLNNAGTVAAEAVGGSGIQISNGGTHVITNSGQITAPSIAIFDIGGTSNDTVRNSGTINGGLLLSGGNDTVNNSGTINGNVLLGNDTNRLTNSGALNSVSGGSGSDTVTDFVIVGDVIKSGTITGFVSLGGGNDTFNGGANPETVLDGDGADIMSLGGGNDRYTATGNNGADGIDTVRGGAGIDTYDASAAISTVQINLDTVAHAGMGLVAANTATGFEIAGIANDTIFGFENASGGDQ